MVFVDECTVFARAGRGGQGSASMHSEPFKPRGGTDGGNGLYRYTTTPSTFPDQTYNSENYWVDVVFEDGPDATKPTVTARTPAPGATGVGVGANVTATFSEPVQQSTLGLELRTPGGALVAGTTTYDAATRTATLDPGTNLVDVHLTHLRRKLGPGPVRIETIRGVGIRLEIDA